MTNNSVLSLIIDTNILSYLGDKAAGAAFDQYLREKIAPHFTSYICTFSVYEILRGIKVAKEKQILEIIKKFPSYAITNQVLLFAAQLDSLYKSEQINVSSPGIIGDELIAATAILSDAYILTANMRDFPQPYFKEISREYINFTVSNYIKTIVVGLLQPDTHLIKARYSQRE